MLTRTALRRLLGFGACLLGAAVCFFVAFLTLPWIALRPAKFALAFRYGMRKIVRILRPLMTVLHTAWGVCS